MKAITTLSIICLLGVFGACQGQVKKEVGKTKKLEATKSADTTEQMNLLDEQTKIFGSIFASMGEDNPVGGVTNYLELLEKSEMPAEQKQQLRETYELYDASLDPKRKEELKIRVNKMLKVAMEKGNTEN